MERSNNFALFSARFFKRGSSMKAVRTLLLATTGVVALIGSTFAADMAVRAPAPLPPPSAPLYNWTGFYAGLNAGYHWGRKCVDTVTTNLFLLRGFEGLDSAIGSLGTGSACPDDNGFIGGGQFGYNWQFTNWVIGFETDIQGASNNNNQDTITNKETISGFSLVPVSSTGTITSEKDLKWLGTVRGRLGFLAAPSFLVYGTGGLAYGKVEATTTVGEVLGFSNVAPFGASGSFSDKRTGWTVGGGVEWMFAPNWSVKAEYLYYNLGQVTWPLANFNSLALLQNVETLLATSGSQSTTRFNGNIIRAGINWHF
jgi:outer membrane immunogenic protein